MQFELKKSRYVNPKEAIPIYNNNNGKICTFARKAFLSLNGISFFFSHLQVESKSAMHLKRLFNEMSCCCLCTSALFRSILCRLWAESFKSHTLKRSNKYARALNIPISVFMQLKNEILIGAGFFCLQTKQAIASNKSLSSSNENHTDFCAIKHSFFSAKEKRFSVCVT